MMNSPIVIPARNVKSLTWRGDDLADVLGCQTFSLDGTVRRSGYSWAYKFDTVRSSQSQNYALVLTRVRTKGLVLRQDKMLREINRSFYQAHAYEYPATIFTLPDGREVLAHCPEHYNRIEFDELPSFERLTTRPIEKAADFFHSRLAANPQGTWLLSAGWFWHPLQSVAFFEINRALSDPSSLDKSSFTPPVEVHFAAFRSEIQALLVCEADAEIIDDEHTTALRPSVIAVYDVASQTTVSVTPLSEPAGTIAPIGQDHVLSLYDHLKVIELGSGKIVQRWEHLKTGRSDRLDSMGSTATTAVCRGHCETPFCGGGCDVHYGDPVAVIAACGE